VSPAINDPFHGVLDVLFYVFFLINAQIVNFVKEPRIKSQQNDRNSIQMLNPVVIYYFLNVYLS